MELANTLPMLLGLAWLVPLGSFVLILLFGPRMGRAGRGAGREDAGRALTGSADWTSRRRHRRRGRHLSAPKDR